VFSFVIFFSHVLGGPDGEHKGSLHCADLRGLRPGNGLYPRHDLDRSYTSNDKTKKKKKKNKTVAGSNKRVTARIYEIKTGYCLTGQYLEWTENRTSVQCWWCSCKEPTREHVFKNCGQWKERQKVLWKEEWK